MKEQPYYLAYEARYRTVFEAGAEFWGHSPQDEELYQTLKQWVSDNRLEGKRIIEFACGEGGSGAILSKLGCLYHGVDISPSAVAKAKETLRDYPNASVAQMDMVRECATTQYDAALDSMGLHMLVTDGDRASYLRNAFSALKDGSPMLFYKESYRTEGSKQLVKAPVPSYEDWLKITGDDYITPSARSVETAQGQCQVMIPLVPARANDREGYVREFEAAGFTVEKFAEMNPSRSIVYAASIYVRKP